MTNGEGIPDSWDIKKISEAVEAKNGGTPKRSNGEYWDGNINWLSSGEIRGKEVYQAEENITQKGLEESSAKIFPKDSVLVAMYGDGDTKGRSTIVREEMSGNQAICCLTPKEDQLSEEYLLYYIKNIKSDLRQMARGGGQDNLNQSIIINRQIPVPPLDEQKNIVESIEEQLEKLDSLEKSVEQLGSLTTEYEESLLTFLFAGQKNLSSSGPDQIPTENDIPDHWEIKTIEDICGYIQRGKQPDYDDENGRVNIVNQRCIYWDGLRLENTRKLDKEHEEKWQDYRYLQEGDILVNSTGVGTLGRVQIWDIDTSEDYVVDGHVTILRVNEEVRPEYLYQFLKSPFGQGQIDEFTRGSTGQTELYKKHITSIAIPVPPSDEQKEIVEQVEAVDMNRVKRAVEDVEKLFTEYRESVVSHAFIKHPNDDGQSEDKQLTLSEI